LLFFLYKKKKKTLEGFIVKLSTVTIEERQKEVAMAVKLIQLSSIENIDLKPKKKTALSRKEEREQKRKAKSRTRGLFNSA
jgi:hypothetical protein